MITRTDTVITTKQKIITMTMQDTIENVVKNMEKSVDTTKQIIKNEIEVVPTVVETTAKLLVVKWLLPVILSVCIWLVILARNRKKYYNRANK